eukprot:3408235-Lingulodinium_polyedra.AAC.1
MLVHGAGRHSSRIRQGRRVGHRPPGTGGHPEPGPEAAAVPDLGARATGMRPLGQHPRAEGPRELGAQAGPAALGHDPA